MVPGDVTKRLEQAIRQEEQRARREHARSSERQPLVEDAFHPVVEAANEIRERLYTETSLHFTINPDSVWITLGERTLRFAYSLASEKFIGEESGYNWYDAEPYTENYEWDTAEACIDAMIRSCARYAHMARAIKSAISEA